MCCMHVPLVIHHVGDIRQSCMRYWEGLVIDAV